MSLPSPDHLTGGGAVVAEDQGEARGLSRRRGPSNREGDRGNQKKGKGDDKPQSTALEARAQTAGPPRQ